MAEQKFGWRRENVSALPNPSPTSHDKPDEKSKDAPAIDQPPAQPGNSPAKASPALKS